MTAKKKTAKRKGAAASTDVPMVDISALKPWPRNPRQHSDEQVALLVNSLNEIGWVRPILCDERMTILAGHGMWAAAKAAGHDQVPVIVKAGLTIDQKRAYVLADNKLQERGGWNDALLLEELRALDPDMLELTGFADYDLKSLMAVGDDDADMDGADDIPETVVTRCQAGDLWALGDHRLLCGDSTNADHVDTLMGGGMADMVLTDPPYGVAYTGKTGDALTIENDDCDEDQLAALVSAAFDSAERACRAGAYWYATVPAGPLHLVFADDWKRRGVLRQIMVWAKDSMVLGHSEYHYQHEPILFGWLPGERHKNADRTRTTLWQYDRPKASREHPTMKPAELWAQAVRDGSRQGEIVYDPFCGSGTTVVVCEKMGRMARCMELSPRYCDVILSRWEGLAGERADRLSNIHGNA